MASSTCSFLARVSLPALLLAHHTPPLPITSCRLRPGAARSFHRVVAAAAAARPARSTLGSVRYGAGAAALRAEEAEVQSVPPSVPVRVAYELQQAGHRYLDVRYIYINNRCTHHTITSCMLCPSTLHSVPTEGEFGSAGHPAGAVNVPYMHSTGSGVSKNTHFVEQVSAIFGRDTEIIIGCQSGRRSLMAAAELCSVGFTAVTDIAGGFSAWRENGLPVSR